MNREEAQFILGAYRPDTADALDPQFQEALALARRDPALARWLSEEQALDRAFAAKLRAQPVPTGLKEQLLCARVTRRRSPWWRRPAWLAAACFSLVLGVVGLTLRSPSAHGKFAQLRTAMIAAAADMDDHADVWGLDAAGYQRWLAEHRGHPDFVLPPGLADKGISACKVIEWQQIRITMICFKFSGQHVDVFVFKADDFPGLKMDATPTFFSEGVESLAAWQQKGKIYLIAGTSGKSALEALL
jgi:hypothetical protein